MSIIYIDKSFRQSKRGNITVYTTSKILYIILAIVKEPFFKILIPTINKDV